MQGNASSKDGNKHLNATIVLAKIAISFFKKFQVGDIREIPFIYKDFSPKFKEIYQKLLVFMDKHVYPNEQLYQSQVRTGAGRWKITPECIAPIQQEA